LLWSQNLVSRWRRVRAQEVLFRQLHALIRAGIPLPTAFVQLRRFAPSPSTAEALSAIGRQVASGASLADAFAAHPHVFEPDQVELLAAAEHAGTLDTALRTLADHLEAVRRLRWNALVASIWPAYLVATLVFLGPLLSAVSTARGLDTLLVTTLAGVARSLGMLAATATGVVLAPVVIAALKLERPVDALLLQVPGLGGALRTFAASRALLTLGLALGAGVEVARSVKVALLATARPSLVPQTDAVVARLRSGSTLADALTPVGLFERELLGQLAVAETTGTLDETLKRLAPEVHESALRAVRVLMFVVLGVVAVVTLALLVSSLVGAIFGPIKTLYDTAGGVGPTDRSNLLWLERPSE
jgi:type II secretory pathway component PulF